jgi:hypothetical protein
MSAAEHKLAHKMEIDGIRAEADKEASKAGRWARAWKWLARLADLMAIVLAAVAAATSGVALDTVFVAVPAGLAAIGAGVGQTVRPGQLAARAAAARGEWQQLTSDVDRAMGGWDDLSAEAAKTVWDCLRHRRDEIRRNAKPKRSEFPPATW